MGPSFKYKGTQVVTLIKRGFPVSARLGGVTIITVLIIGIPFEIIGLLEKKGTSMLGSNDNKIIIPYTIAQRLIKNSIINNYILQVSDTQSVDYVMEMITTFLTGNFLCPASFVFFTFSVLSTLFVLSSFVSVLIVSFSLFDFIQEPFLKIQTYNLHILLLIHFLCINLL
jgi:hypothetical protein